jgi:hypothetical protein
LIRPAPHAGRTRAGRPRAVYLGARQSPRFQTVKVVGYRSLVAHFPAAPAFGHRHRDHFAVDIQSNIEFAFHRCVGCFTSYSTNPRPLAPHSGRSMRLGTGSPGATREKETARTPLLSTSARDTQRCPAAIRSRQNLCPHIANIMKRSSGRLFYINLGDWTWWAWTITTVLLIVGLSGYSLAFVGAMAVTAGQGLVLLVRDRSLAAFSVQLRAAYLLLLLISYPPPMRWLYWLPTVGTFALIVFGYCLLARVLSLLPWNSGEAYTLARLRRTFFSAPNLDRVKTDAAATSCAGGLCTIEAQVPPSVPHGS